MLAYVARRLLMALAVIYVVVTLSFFLVRLMPGNAMAAMEAQLQQQGGATPQEIQQKVNAIYGVMPKAPVWRQYLTYISHTFQGNLGRSMTNPGESVIHIIAGALPWTIVVVGLALIISFVIGIAIGAFMASFRNSPVTKCLTFLTSLTSSIPNYLIAIALLYLLADAHHIFPLGGAYSVNVRVGFTLAFLGSLIVHATLPISAYVITSFGGWALAMKGTAIAVLGEDYVRAAEARGLSGRRITESYVGRNALLPHVTNLALSIGFMFGGSVFIETYFTYPGIGYYMIQSVNSRDYSLALGCFLLITVSVVIGNFVVDLMYPLIDPRIVRPAARKRTEETTPAEAPAVEDLWGTSSTTNWPSTMPSGRAIAQADWDRVPTPYWPTRPPTVSAARRNGAKDRPTVPTRRITNRVPAMGSSAAARSPGSPLGASRKVLGPHRAVRSRANGSMSRPIRRRVDAR